MARVSYPADFTATDKDRYRETKKFIEKGKGGWDDVYASTLERYVRAWRFADQAQELLIEEGLTVDGSRGQKVQHPAWKTYGEACRIMESAARALLLTPEARAKLDEPAAPKAGKFGEFG